MLFRLYLSLHVLTAALHSLVVQVNNSFRQNMFANKGRSHSLVSEYHFEAQQLWRLKWQEISNIIRPLVSYRSSFRDLVVLTTAKAPEVSYPWYVTTDVIWRAAERDISVNVLGIVPAEGRYYTHLVNRNSPVLECCPWEDVPGRWILSVIVNTTLESSLSLIRGPNHEMRARHGRGQVIDVEEKHRSMTD